MVAYYPTIEGRFLGYGLLLMMKKKQGCLFTIWNQGLMLVILLKYENVILMTRIQGFLYMKRYPQKVLNYFKNIIQFFLSSLTLGDLTTSYAITIN